MSAQSLAAIGADTVIPTTVTTPLIPLDVQLVPVQGIQAQLHKYAIWFFLIIAIIVLVILFWIAKPSQEWFANLNNSWEWLKADNMTVMVIIMVIVVLLMAYVSYAAYMKAALADRNAIILTFSASMLLLILWFTIFYNQKSLNAAAWIGIAVLVAGLIQTWYVFKVDKAAGWGMIPYLIWVITAVAFNFQLSSSNPLSE